MQAQLNIEERRVARELAEAAAKRRAEIEAEIRAVYQPAETTSAPAPTKGRK